MSRNRRITRYFRPDTNSTAGESSGTNSSLPSRLFATDRYPEARLNIYSKPDILCFVRKHLKGTEEWKKIRDSCFGPLFSLPVYRSSISCKLIHALLARQLVSKKKYEMWTVFGGQPMRFSLADFGAISGLPCGEFPEEHDFEDRPRPSKKLLYFYDEFLDGDRKTTLADLGNKLILKEDLDSDTILRIALILIVDGVLIAEHQVHRPTFKYVQMLENIDTFLAFPWGRESFLWTISTMIPGPKVPGKVDDHLNSFRLLLQQKTTRLNGFPLALQLIAFNNIPLLLDCIPCASNPCTFIKWSSVSLPKQTSLLLNVIHNVELDPDLSVDPYTRLDSTPSDWDDEVRDTKISFMVQQIEAGYKFAKTEWPGGDSSHPFILVLEKKPDVDHRKHIITRKRKVENKTADSASGSKRIKRTAKRSLPGESELKDLFESRLNNLEARYDLRLQKLSSRQLRLEKKLKACKFRRSRKLSCHLPRQTSKKRPIKAQPHQHSTNHSPPVSPQFIVSDNEPVSQGPCPSSKVLHPTDVLSNSRNLGMSTEIGHDEEDSQCGHHSMDMELDKVSSSMFILDKSTIIPGAEIVDHLNKTNCPDNYQAVVQGVLNDLHVLSGHVSMDEHLCSPKHIVPDDLHPQPEAEIQKDDDAAASDEDESQTDDDQDEIDGENAAHQSQTANDDNAAHQSAADDQEKSDEEVEGDEDDQDVIGKSLTDVELKRVEETVDLDYAKPVHSNEKVSVFVTDNEFLQTPILVGRPSSSAVTDDPIYDTETKHDAAIRSKQTMLNVIYDTSMHHSVPFTRDLLPILM